MERGLLNPDEALALSQGGGASTGGHGPAGGQQGRAMAAPTHHLSELNLPGSSRKEDEDGNFIDTQLQIMKGVSGISICWNLVHVSIQTYLFASTLL